MCEVAPPVKERLRLRGEKGEEKGEKGHGPGCCNKLRFYSSIGEAGFSRPWPMRRVPGASLESFPLQG